MTRLKQIVDEDLINILSSEKKEKVYSPLKKFKIPDDLMKYCSDCDGYFIQLRVKLKIL